MKLLFIIGSARKESKSCEVVKNVQHYLKENQIKKSYPLSNVVFETVDMRHDPLPVYNGDESQIINQHVSSLKEKANDADGFFIITPEYHNGMSGSLKNALDFLNLDQFKEKPVAIAAAAGGGKGGINALNNLRLVLRGVGANVLSEQVVVDGVHFNEKAILSDEPITSRLHTLFDTLMDEMTIYIKHKT